MWQYKVVSNVNYTKKNSNPNQIRTYVKVIGFKIMSQTHRFLLVEVENYLCYYSKWRKQVSLFALQTLYIKSGSMAFTYWQCFAYETAFYVFCMTSKELYTTTQIAPEKQISVTDCY